MKWINDDRFYKNVKSATFYNDKGEVDNILKLDEYGSDVYSMNFERYDSNKNLIYEESDNSFDPMRYEPLNDQSGYLITNTSSKKYFLYDINNVLQETISFVCEKKVVEYHCYDPDDYSEHVGTRIYTVKERYVYNSDGSRQTKIRVIEGNDLPSIYCNEEIVEVYEYLKTPSWIRKTVTFLYGDIKSKCIENYYDNDKKLIRQIESQYEYNEENPVCGFIKSCHNTEYSDFDKYGNAKREHHIFSEFVNGKEDRKEHLYTIEFEYYD